MPRKKKSTPEAEASEELQAPAEESAEAPAEEAPAPKEEAPKAAAPAPKKAAAPASDEPKPRFRVGQRISTSKITGRIERVDPKSVTVNTGTRRVRVPY